MSLDGGRPRPAGQPRGREQGRQRPGIFVGRLYDVPVFVSPSWLVPAVFITVLYADVFDSDRAVETAPGPVAYLLSFGVAVLVGLSILLHEASHSLTARALGLPVRRIVIHLVGGVSEVEREPETPAREYLVAVSGPLLSLLLAGVGLAMVEPLDGHAARYAAVFGLVNGLVGVLNLLPGLPLDGGRVLHAALWRALGDPHRASVLAANAGRLLAVAIALAPIARQAAVGPGDGSASTADLDVIWGILVGLYVWGGATAELRNAELRRRLPALRVRDLLRRVLAVAHDLPLAEAVRQARETGARALVTVDRGGRPTGVVSEQAVMATPVDRQPWMPVSQVARPIAAETVLHVDAAGEAVFDTLRTHPASEYLVADGSGEVLGVLATADVAALLGGPQRRPPQPPPPPAPAPPRQRALR